MLVAAVPLAFDDAFDWRPLPFALAGADELVSEIVVTGGEGRNVAIEGMGVAVFAGFVTGVDVAGLVSMLSFTLASRRDSA